MAKFWPRKSKSLGIIKGGMMSSSRIRQEKVPRFFARKLLFPCANPPIML